jgi:hypothetical protein
MPTEDRTAQSDAPLLDELWQVVPKLVDRTRSQAEFARSLAGLLPCLGPLVARRPEPQGPGVPEHERVDVLSILSQEDPDESTATAATPEPRTPATDAASAPPEPPPAESELPIQDYDSLAASQVVPRLSTLSHDELRSVQSYEAATRRRQTILNRVAQLLSA